MAKLRSSMDAAYGDLNISSPHVLIEGSAKLVPGESFPLNSARASRAIRPQQLSLLGNGFPLGLIPSYSPPPPSTTLNAKDSSSSSSFALQSLLLTPNINDWWLGIIGQLRPKKLFSDIKAEFFPASHFEFPAFNNLTKHIFDKSHYSLGAVSQLAITDSSSVMVSMEGDGEKKGRRTKAMLYHRLPNHDITLEAAWPQLFIDNKGGYWDVPESVFLDLSSLVSESGLRYRVGVQKNGGLPQPTNVSNGIAPLTLMPGLCAKAAFSYEKSRDLWRRVETEKEATIRTEKGWFWNPSYDTRLKEPHISISGILGGTCAAWYGDKESRMAIDSRENVNSKRTISLNADLFGSGCCALQHGYFRKLYGDLTRLDARLDICSASAFTKGVINIFKRPSANDTKNPLSSPRLSLTFQQQVIGPVVFRVDSKFKVDSRPYVEDLMYSLSYSLRLLGSGKVVAWYSPMRKEGMVELRLYEF